MSWVDRALKCLACGGVTYRPPRSEALCRCGGGFRDETPAEGAERRQRALAVFLERPS
jgi:hypothetical protein